MGKTVERKPLKEVKVVEEKMKLLSFLTEGAVLVKNFERFQADRELLNEKSVELGLPPFKEREWPLSFRVYFVMKDLNDRRLKFEDESGKEKRIIITAFDEEDEEKNAVIYNFGYYVHKERKIKLFAKVVVYSVNGEEKMQIEFFNKEKPFHRELRKLFGDKLKFYVKRVSSREMSDYVNYVMSQESAYKVARNTYLVPREVAQSLTQLIKEIDAEYSEPPLFILEYATESARELIYESFEAKVRNFKKLTGEALVKKRKELLTLENTLSYFSRDYAPAQLLLSEIQEIIKRSYVEEALIILEKAEEGKVKTSKLKWIVENPDLPIDLKNRAMKLLATVPKKTVIIRKPKKVD